MDRTKSFKIAGFAGALCASAALVGFAATGTGAYFTDSKDGSITASTGAVKVNTTDLALNYTNLLPGAYDTKTIGYSSSGTSGQDVWLVFPATAANRLTGEDGSAPNGNDALGRYGHFKVTSPAGDFVSNNLRSNPGSPADQNCSVDGNGHGGNAAEAATRTDYSLPYCGVPHAILLSDNIQPGQYNEATIEFGFTKIARGPQAVPTQLFKIVATQHGVRPDDANN
ncbi:hypothetical protein [Jatrophihabitans fulvus]